MSLTYLEASLILMLVTILLVMPHPKQKYEPYCISVISKRIIGQAKRGPGKIANPTTPGHISRNKLDSHSNICCDWDNWTPMLYTDKHYEVSPSTYDLVQEVPFARCCTVWTLYKGKEYLLVRNKMLWFRNTLADLLTNHNQLRAYGILVKDDSFNANEFGINADEGFIQFDKTGKIIYFHSRVPTYWETTQFPVILLIADTWDPKTVNLRSGCSSSEEAEILIVCSLTSGMNRRTISAVRQEQSVSRQVRFGQVEQQLMKISSTFDERTFCKRLIGKVNIASTYREDVDGWT